MKQVLYIGPYYANTVYGHIARHIIRGLRLADIRLIIRPFYNSDNLVTTNEFSDLEREPLFAYDTIIQDCPAHLLDINLTGKNIAVYHPKTILPNTDTRINRLSYMDAIWTIGEHPIVYSVTEKHVKLPQRERITLPPEYFDDKTVIEVDNTEDKKLFGWVGDSFYLDGLDIMIKAFHIAFHRRDNVGLIICVPPELVDQTKEGVKQIKSVLRLYPSETQYYNETVVGIPYNQQHALHKVIHNYVNTSRTKFYDKFLHEELACGKCPIFMRYNGYTPCLFTASRTIDFFTAREKLHQENIYDVVEQLQELKNSRDVCRPQETPNLERFSKYLESIL